MPYLLLLVNVQVSDEDAFSREFTKACVKALRRPEAEITTNITYNAAGAAGSLGFGLTIVGLDTLDPEPKRNAVTLFPNSWQAGWVCPRIVGSFASPTQGTPGLRKKWETSD
ncbi:hypothetical protein B0H14DRAFT_67700 [Mycena olivaceomarginata]|nr:hypothetical protein B0H14DRAFT_67700 [Mycena olivaceomarginata]